MAISKSLTAKNVLLALLKTAVIIITAYDMSVLSQLGWSQRNQWDSTFKSKPTKTNQFDQKKVNFIEKQLPTWMSSSTNLYLIMCMT